MKQGLTAAVIGGAAVLVLSIAVLIRLQEQPDESGAGSRRGGSEGPAAGAVGAPPVDADAQQRDRVEDRLNRLRAAHESHRQAAGPAPGGRAEAGGTREFGEAEVRQLPVPPREIPVARPQAQPPAPAPAAEVPLDDSREIAALERKLLGDPDPEERINAVLFLGNGEPRVVVPILLKGLSDSNPEVRLTVVETLGDYSEHLTPKNLAEAVKDPDPEVRFEAVSILGEMETPESRELVAEAVTDPDEDVRDLAEGIMNFEE